VTQNKTLHFSKRVEWIIILYGGIPQQVIGSTSTRRSNIITLDIKSIMFCVKLPWPCSCHTIVMIRSQIHHQPCVSFYMMMSPD